MEFWYIALAAAIYLANAATAVLAQDNAETVAKL